MTVSANDPAALRAVLAENLAELTALLDGVSGADLDVRLGDGEWSVREIVLHLLHAERWLLPQLTELRRAVAPGLPLRPPDVVALPTIEELKEENELR